MNLLAALLTASLVLFAQNAAADEWDLKLKEAEQKTSPEAERALKVKIEAEIRRAEGFKSEVRSDLEKGCGAGRSSYDCYVARREKLQSFGKLSTLPSLMLVTAAGFSVARRQLDSLGKGPQTAELTAKKLQYGLDFLESTVWFCDQATGPDLDKNPVNLVLAQQNLSKMARTEASLAKVCVPVKSLSPPVKGLLDRCRDYISRWSKCHVHAH